mmetsp:Transcript_53017/g.168226  ORF Transcript_53017/g.168226 Transcript_53017/m.168226 type:complete len:202 (-) Transcript_53017:403-1008(-)
MPGPGAHGTPLPQREHVHVRGVPAAAGEGGDGQVPRDLAPEPRGDGDHGGARGGGGGREAGQHLRGLGDHRDPPAEAESGYVLHSSGDAPCPAGQRGGSVHHSFPDVGEHGGGGGHACKDGGDAHLDLRPPRVLQPAFPPAELPRSDGDDEPVRAQGPPACEEALPRRQPDREGGDRGPLDRGEGYSGLLQGPRQPNQGAE